MLLCLPMIGGLHAQESPPAQMKDNTFIPGVIVVPLKGMPFSASVEVVSKRPLPDGSVYTGHTFVHIARSSSGVVYGERRKREPLDFKGKFPLLSFNIYNPETHIRTTLFPDTHVARQTVGAGPPVPLGENETAATFLARKRNFSATAEGKSEEISIGDDYVYDGDLGVYLLQRHNDPRTGEWTVNANIKRVEHHEPDSKLFRIPSAYRVVGEPSK